MTDSQFGDANIPERPATEPEDVHGAETMPTASTGEAALTPRGRKTLRFVVAVVVVVLGVGGYLFISNMNKGGDDQKIQGKVALSAQDLRDVVLSHKLTVYWAGPQTGAKYTLVATSPTASVVKYLPGGVGLNDAKTPFRAVGTYVQKNAFKVNQDSGIINGNTGFINSDGNAVFYSLARPTNIYIGIKGKNIQVEVYDPVVDQALGLVLVRNQIRLIS